jgi:hypothetical protein
MRGGNPVKEDTWQVFPYAFVYSDEKSFLDVF